MPSRLSAYGEIRQIGDAHALFGHKDYRLERTRDGRPGQFTLDVGMFGPQPSLEFSAGRELMAKAGVSLRVVEV
jgi:hypothetical protein